MRCTPASAPFGLAYGEGDTLGAGALARAFAFLQRLPLGLPPPRPIRLCLTRPKVALARAIGRGSPFKVCSSAANVCFASCADNSARSGATRAAKPPKTERGVSRLSKLTEKPPRSVFRLRRASPPIHWISPCGARRADGPRWWCCEGRRCRGSLTQIATIGFLIAASERQFCRGRHRTAALLVNCRGQLV